MILRTESEILQQWDNPGQPLLTIVCPTFNQVRFIEQTLDSFLAQNTRFAFEILVHDDASTDGTTAVLLDYARRYPRLIRTVLQSENQYSLGKLSLVQMFVMARGQYIAYCEGDDYWTDPHKLQKQVDFLESHLDYVLTYHDALAFNDQGPLGIQLTGKHASDSSREDLQRGRPISTLTSCFRNVLHQTPVELAQAPLGDMCWWAQLGAHGKGKYMSDILPAAYRVHPGGIFSMRGDRKKLCMTLHTRACLAHYYLNRGEQALYEHQLSELLVLALAGLSPMKKVRALVSALGNFARNLYRRLPLLAGR